MTKAIEGEGCLHGVFHTFLRIVEVSAEAPTSWEELKTAGILKFGVLPSKRGRE